MTLEIEKTKLIIENNIPIKESKGKPLSEFTKEINNLFFEEMTMGQSIFVPSEYSTESQTKSSIKYIRKQIEKKALKGVEIIYKTIFNEDKEYIGIRFWRIETNNVDTK